MGRAMDMQPHGQLLLSSGIPQDQLGSHHSPQLTPRKKTMMLVRKWPPPSSQGSFHRGPAD